MKENTSANLSFPPSSPAFSNSVTRCPASAAKQAARMPMGPPPITATFLLRMGLLKMPGSRCAMPALGLTEQKHSHGVCPSPWH